MDTLYFIYKNLFWCKRSFVKLFYEDEIVLPEIHTDDVPWLWLGVRYSDSEIISATELLDNKLHHGLRVTPEWLTKTTHIDGGQWRYIDPKTLEEKDFPSEGFIIE